MSLSAGRVGVRADQVDAHGRVISPSFLNEIMEDLPVWTDLPVRVNGTEEVLPSNTSVPVTSPILTDIDYPDIRRNNQYFTYRESPTTVDGLAKIKSIKGNTLVWNQLVGTLGGAVSKDGVVVTKDTTNLSFSFTGTSEGLTTFSLTGAILKKAHKYFVRGGINTTGVTLYDGYIAHGNIPLQGGIITVPNDNMNLNIYALFQNDVTVNNLVIRPECYDLTLMFGAGNEPTTVKEFTDLFPLSYYKYNAGSLLDFTGTKIKTVGENHLTNDSTKWGNYGTETSGYSSNNARLAPKDYVIPFKAGGTYTFSYVDNGALPSGDYFYIGVNGYDNGSRVFDSTWKTMPYSCTIPSNVDTLRLTYKRSNASWSCTDLVNEIGNRLFFSMVETDSINETELPIETYFPTGMKSAGTVYDELLPTKAITRIGVVDLGTLTWSYLGDSTALRFYATLPSDAKNVDATAVANAITSKYPVASWNNVSPNVSADKMFALTDTYITIRDTSYTNATAFKTSLSGIYLYYELATPVELPTLSFE